MDTTMLVAKVLGIYLVISGLFLLIKGKSVAHLIRDFVGHPAIMYLTGAILVFLSAIYLLQYNVWDGTFDTLVTLFVWIVLLKGLAYIFVPSVISEAAIKNSRKLFSLYGVIAVLMGLYLFF